MPVKLYRQPASRPRIVEIDFPFILFAVAVPVERHVFCHVCPRCRGSGQVHASENVAGPGMMPFQDFGFTRGERDKAGVSESSDDTVRRSLFAETFHCCYLG